VDRIQGGWHVFALQVHQDRFLGTVSGITSSTTGEPGVAFTSSDCTGQPVVAREGNDETMLLPVTQVAGPGSTVYLQEPGSVSQLLPLQSVLNVRGICEPTGQTGTRVFPAQQLIDLDALFAPPFHVR
jgi:hypothetical protein